MFGKLFRIKSSTAIRGSDRKKLKQRIRTSFPTLSDDHVNNIIPNKEEMNVLKILTHSEINVTCYTVVKNPIFFEYEGNIFPTVYLLWQYPDMMPSLMTWPPVFQKIKGGADLMLPGVVSPPTGLPEFQKESVIGINFVGNRAPVAVGLANMSSREAVENGMRGKGIQVKHYFTDHLWMLGDQSQLPLLEDQIFQVDNAHEELPVAATVGEASNQVELGSTGDEERLTATENVSLANMKISSDRNVVTDDNHFEITEKVNSETLIADELPLREEETNKIDVLQEEDDDMDTLLKNSFFQALLDAKKAELPMLASTFSSEYLRNACPDGKQLDIKKSTFKKLSKFLQEMKKEGLIEVKQLTKGVDSITGMTFNHPHVLEYKKSQFAEMIKGQRIKGAESTTETNVPQVQDLYAVSAKTTPLFGTNRKGQVFTVAEVRNYVTDYIKTEKLADPDKKGHVHLDAVLNDILKQETGGLYSISWDKLMSGIISKMNPCFTITLAGQEPIFRKGKLEPVEVKVEQRMGNKKVTLVKNIEQFGIDAKEFANQLQQAAASSTSVSQLPGKNNPGNQVLVQGNQISHVAQLLERHKVPKKFITGLNKAKTNKKPR